MTILPVSCPFCGSLPVTTNNQFLHRGSNWARVECVSEHCVANPCVAVHKGDCEPNVAYMATAINRWNDAIQRNRKAAPSTNVTT